MSQTCEVARMWSPRWPAFQLERRLWLFGPATKFDAVKRNSTPVPAREGQWTRHPGLVIYPEPPPGFWSTPPRQLWKFCGGRNQPLLVWVQPPNPTATNERPLFVSVGLHGNERNGWEAVRNAVGKMLGNKQKRPLLLMIFNARNLKQGNRGVPDPNRIWNGRSPAVARIRAYLRSVKPASVIDLHACEGRHPVVTIIRGRDPNTLALARFIGCPVVQADLRGTLGGDMGPALGVPSLTVELGPFDDPSGIRFGSRLIRKLLSGSVPDASARSSKERAGPKSPTLYRVTGSIHVRDGVSFAFAPGPKADVIFRADIDRLANLKRVPKGTALGIAMTPSVKKPLAVYIGGRRQPFGDWFEVRTDGRLVTRRPWTGLFASADADYIRNEALSFIVEPELP